MFLSNFFKNFDQFFKILFKALIHHRFLIRVCLQEITFQGVEIPTDQQDFFFWHPTLDQPDS